MAWISVHDRVRGPKLRSLAKDADCSEFEALGVLVAVWLWGFENCDRDGLIIDAGKSDIAAYIYQGLDDRYDAKKFVDSMVKTGWIDEDQNGLYIHDWCEWQEPLIKLLDYRERDAKRKRAERALKKKTGAIRKVTEENVQVKNGESTVSPEKKKAEDYPKHFEEFWSVYPKKAGKGEAYKKYKARLNDGWSEEELKYAAGRYAEYVRRMRIEDQYIKHAKTFLSDATPFKDYLKKEETSGSNAASDDPYSGWRR